MQSVQDTNGMIHAIRNTLHFPTDCLHTCKVNRPGQTCASGNVQREKCISAAGLAYACVKIPTKDLHHADEMDEK